MLKYKGYAVHIEFDEARLFHDEVIDLRNVVAFKGPSVGGQEAI